MPYLLSAQLKTISRLITLIILFGFISLGQKYENTKAVQDFIVSTESCDPEIYYGIEHCTDGDYQIIRIDPQAPQVHFETVLAEGFDRGGHYGECRDVNVPSHSSGSGCEKPRGSEQYPAELVSTMASRNPGTVVAFNADFFALDHSHGPEGLTVKEGERFDGLYGDYDQNEVIRGSLSIAQNGEVRIGIVDRDSLPNPSEPWDWIPDPFAYYNTIGGLPILVRNGIPVNISEECADEGGCSSPFETRARTAVGKTADGEMIVLVVPEGENGTPSPPGVTLQELAQKMFELGAVEAINLDGGGSSQLWYNNIDLISSSDDPNRSVAEGLLVFSERVSHEKPFSNWFPWYYLISTGDYRVTQVYLDGQLLFERPDCAIALWVGAGDHIVRFYYEDPGAGIPEVEINSWPFVEPVCAAPPSDPPPTDPPPSGEVDNAFFVTDVTIPDGTVVSPGQALLKTWRMRNTGTTTWGSGYQLVFINGEQMGSPSAVNVPETTSGQEINISVNLTAPNSHGEHTGYWRLRNPQGTFFGPTIWVNINVGTASNYISVLTTDPPSPADTNQVTIHARADNFPNFRAMRLKIDGNVVYELGAPEFYYDWQTDNYTPGEHTILVEVADWTDLSWNHPETRATTYVLTGNGAPTNHAPYPPNPTSLDDWHVYYTGNTAQLCAQDTGDPDGTPITQYQFDIHDSAQLWNSGWVSSNCVTTSSLGPYSYQWRVKVRDDQGAESGWSNSRHFTLVNPILTITELYFEPQDPNSEAVKIRACTAGQGGVGITMRVSVNDANDGSDSGEWHVLKELGVPCFNADDAPIWFTLPYGPSEDPQQHLIRVEAHGSDTGWNGAAVREASYPLPYRRPPANHLVAPIPVSGNTRDPIYLNGRTITFRWQPALRATSLTLHVSTNPSPKDDPNPVFRQTFTPPITEHQITFSQDYPTLYWQVEASNSAAGTSASGDQQFGIDRASPSCSIGTLPDTTFENVFQVSWATSDALSGVKTADIQYRDSREGEWRNWLTEIPAIQTYALFYGEAGHAYQFRCRATDNANNSSIYSQPSNEIHVDPTARPAEPWWDTAYAHKRGILVLNNMPASNLPAGYPIHIRFDDTTTPSAADIYNASTAPVKCDDLRVVYNHSLELDRYVGSCQINEIDIWFQSQAAISPGDVDDTSYRLYYGNALAENPPADQTTIWHPQLDANTVGLWYFSEGSGSTTSDYSGYGNHGTTGILTWADENFGHALTSPYHGPGPNGVFIPGNASLGSPVFTLEFFAKRYTMHPEGYIAGMGMSGNGRERMRLLIDSPGKIKFQIDPEPGGASDVWANSGCLADLEWHHVAVTFDGDRTGNIYCDGVLAGSGLFNQSGISNLNFDLHLGSDFSTGTRFNGAIDQVRLSNIVRTSFPYAVQALITNEPTIATGDPITPPTGNQPDLTVVSLRSYPNPEGGLLIEAVLKNEGLVPTQNGFFTDLYWDHRPTEPGDYTNSLQFWVNSPIQAGDTVTVTTVITDMAILPTTQTNNLGALQELNGMVYAQVDSTGAVGEANNTNNISSQGTQVCVAGADVYEGDNSWQVATPVSWDSSQKHNIHTLNDEDWFAIQVTANQTYTIKTTRLASSADTYLYLYDTDGTTLLTSNDDYNGTLASQVNWLAPTTGTYYVQVKHWNPNVGGCNTGYTILFGWTSVYLPIIIRPAPQENTIPNAPTNFRFINATDSTITVAWNDNSQIETQYEIKFRPTGGAWSTAYDSANTEQYTLTYLTCGTTYEMYVYAVYWPSGGQRYESASSNWINPITPSCN